LEESAKLLLCSRILMQQCYLNHALVLSLSPLWSFERPVVHISPIFFTLFFPFHIWFIYGPFFFLFFFSFLSFFLFSPLLPFKGSKSFEDQLKSKTAQQ